MSSEWDRTCLVCGIKTENRCSSCAKAGIDLFFCSPDHQKLVWKAHRRVCGPGKANPFMWPPLSQREADEIIGNLDDKAAVFASHSSSRTTLADCLQDCAHVQREEVPLVINSLAVPHPPGSDESARQVLLGAVRAFETIRKAAPVGDGYYRMPYLDPVTATAYHDLNNIDSVNAGRTTWRTKYRHLLSIQLFLLDLWDRSQGRDVPIEWFERIFARENDFVRVHIVPDHPASAASLITDQPASAILAERLEQSYS